MPALPRLAWALCALSFSSLFFVARVSRADTYSKYEQQTIDQVLEDMAAKSPSVRPGQAVAVDAAPDGKTIERIDIARIDVFEKRDPVPLFLNVFHTLTKEPVIAREVLLREGQPYRQDLADETQRNLRRLPQLSLVIVVPLQGSSPDRVRLLVITKDVWSLRMGFDIGLSSSGLESLLLEPTESNMAGTQQLVLGRFTYRPNSFSLGTAYRVPRVQGLWLALNMDANIVVNRERGTPEGSYGIVSASRPLYSKYTEWSWGSQVAWRDEVLRRYIGIKVARFNADATPGVNDAIPYQYRGRRYTSTHSITRSFGLDIKNDFTIGAEMNLRAYRTAFDADLPDGAPRPVFAPEAVAEFERRFMPRSDTRVGPFLQWHGYTNRFHRVLDFESLSLQEDYRLGHDLWLRVYPVSSGLGSSRSFLGVYAAAQYTIPWGDGLVRAAVEATNEFQSDRISDASVELDLRISTPHFGFGRLVFDSVVLNRYRNYLNRRTFLGGDTRLRGFPSSYFDGQDLFVSNVEFRTRPIAVFSVQLAGALFYDVGSAFEDFDHVKMHQSAGAGFRVLFPQVDRIVFRGDFGFPLDRPAGVAPLTFFFTFQQAFGLPGVGTLPGQGTASTWGMLGQ
ncbi:hypothetical protein LVJ94_23660 [Pendulispora rubella]|uniref:Bacterial surface antigen (D15) domain-containing protein n=1 Tax=Pendulispora rubella TaxID=2741070 RepID=A0ABZ2LMV6_9BACT